MTKIENMRKLEDSSYRFIFKIINNLRKRKHRKQTKIIQENFPRTERHEFPGGKDFPGAQHSGFTARHIFKKFQNSYERQKKGRKGKQRGKTNRK